MQQEIEILKVEEKRQAWKDRQQFAEMRKDEYLYNQHVITSKEADKIRRFRREGKSKEYILAYFKDNNIELNIGQKEYLERMYA